ncbi:hypothetical protein WJX77_003825 [Trebouxia sp. C0004]
MPTARLASPENEYIQNRIAENRLRLQSLGILHAVPPRQLFPSQPIKNPEHEKPRQQSRRGLIETLKEPLTVDKHNKKRKAQVFQNNNRKEEMLVGVQILGRHWHYMCKEGRKKELAIRNSPEPAQSHGSIPDDASPQDDASLNCE